MHEVLYLSVLNYLRLRLPTLSLQSWISPGTGIPLLPDAVFFDYVILSGRRYWSASRTNNVANALVAIRKADGTFGVGELKCILGLVQDAIPVQRLGYVSWLVPDNVEIPPSSAWNSRYVLI